jgi:hypothetical protein
MRSSWMRLVVLVGAVVTGSPYAGWAQGAPDTGPTIEVHLRTLKQGGGVSIMARSDELASVGAPVTFVVKAGSSNPAEMTVCGGGVGGNVTDQLSRNAFVWQIRMSPTKSDADGVTFDLEWARYQADGGGRAAAEGKSTLTLKEGDRQPIDFVRGATGASCRDESAIVEVGTGYREPRALAPSILQYEMWLKQQNANGETIVRRFSAMGAQGSDVDFAFVPLRFAVALPAPDRRAYDVVTTVRGTLKGRLMPNGRIALTVDTTRRVGVGARGAAVSGSSGNTGRKTLDVAPDEPIEIELPAPGGRSTAFTGDGAGAAGRAATPRPAPTEAVSVEKDRIVVNHALFFEGRRTSLIVQVKPVRQ